MLVFSVLTMLFILGVVCFAYSIVLWLEFLSHRFSYGSDGFKAGVLAVLGFLCLILDLHIMGVV